VAPDPASGAQRFEWSRPAGADASLSIHDLTGRRIWSRRSPEDDRRAVWNGITDTGRAAPRQAFTS
jgi:hypothetical protein